MSGIPSKKSKPPSHLFSCLLSFLPICSLFLFLILSEPISVLLLSLGAVLFHELGHLCFFVLSHTPLPHLAADGMGLRLVPSLPLLPRTEALICLGGPLFNFLAAFFSFRLIGGDFAMLLGSLHILYGFFNLIPFADTDGEKLLRILLLCFLGEKGEKVASFLACAFLAFFFFLSLFLYYLTGFGLCGLFFVLFRLFSLQNTVETFCEIS